MQLHFLRQNFDNPKLSARRLLGITSVGGLSVMALALAATPSGNPPSRSPAGSSADNSTSKLSLNPTPPTNTNKPVASAPTTNPANSSNAGSKSIATSTTVQSSTTGSSNSSHATLNVNGQNVAMPQNGSYHKTIATPSGQVQLNVSRSGGDNSASSSTTVQVQSDSADSSVNYQESSP